MNHQLLAHLLAAIALSEAVPADVMLDEASDDSAGQANRLNYAVRRLQVDVLATFRDFELRHSAIVSTPATYDAWATLSDGSVLCLDNKGDWTALSLKSLDGQDWASGAIDFFVPSPDGSRVLAAEGGGRIAVITADNAGFDAKSIWCRRAAIRLDEPGFADGVELHYAHWLQDNTRVLLAYEDGQVLLLDCESMMVADELVESKWSRSEASTRTAMLFPSALNRLVLKDSPVALVVRRSCESAMPLAFGNEHLVMRGASSGDMQTEDGARVSVASDSSHRVIGSDKLIISTDTRSGGNTLTLREVAGTSTRLAQVWSQAASDRFIASPRLEQAVRVGHVVVVLMKDVDGQYYTANLEVPRRSYRLKMISSGRAAPGVAIGLRVNHDGGTGIARLSFPDFSVSDSANGKERELRE